MEIIVTLIRYCFGRLLVFPSIDWMEEIEFYVTWPFHKQGKFYLVTNL